MTVYPNGSENALSPVLKRNNGFRQRSKSQQQALHKCKKVIALLEEGCFAERLLKNNNPLKEIKLGNISVAFVPVESRSVHSLVVQELE